MKKLITHLCIVIFACGFGLGQVKETVLHTFSDADGDLPYGGLTFDSAGNIYGVTDSGGTYNSGTVFELSPSSGGGWTFKSLYSFTGGLDGYQPNGNLAIDSAGNLYGTTVWNGQYQSGTVFELTPSSEGEWTETTIYAFGSLQADGQEPRTGLVFDAAGNLYGTTSSGTAGNCESGCGNVFELTNSHGVWNETILYNFAGGSDGYRPWGGRLALDDQGRLFGTTALGGGLGCQSNGCGIVYVLTPSAGGVWSEAVLHSFNGNDGAEPLSGVVLDQSGNLYGTTVLGGLVPCPQTNTEGCGIVFRLAASRSGGWAFSDLHVFKGIASGDGSNPVGGVVVDRDGRLFGATPGGGASDTGGVVYELQKHGTGVKESLFDFTQQSEGLAPNYVSMDGAGHLYGNFGNSSSGYGAVFELLP
jgi:hypothetical protein